MRRIGVCTLAIGLFATFALVGGAQDSASELKKIQGTWRFIAQEMGGKASTKEDLAKMTIVFTGDRFDVRDDGKTVQAGTHKFDPTKKPGQVDAVITEGEGKDSKMLGIYEMTGDTMKVCFDPMGKARPTSFTPKEGQFSAVVQREKKK